MFAHDLHALGVDFRELFHDGGGLTPRYVLGLLEQMGQDTATAAALAGGRQYRGWTTDTYMLALVVDCLTGANYQRSGGKGRKPKPVPRPDKAKSRRVVRVTDILKARRKRGE